MPLRITATASASSRNGCATRARPRPSRLRARTSSPRSRRNAAGARRVIELGGGTGAITRAARSGIADADLLVLELNAAPACARFRARFPRVRVVSGDAAEFGARPATSTRAAPTPSCPALGLRRWSREAQVKPTRGVRVPASRRRLGAVHPRGRCRRWATKLRDELVARHGPFVLPCRRRRCGCTGAVAPSRRTPRSVAR